MTKLEEVARAMSEKALERHQILLGDQAMTLARAAVEALRAADFRMNDGGLIEHHPLEGPFRLLWGMTIDGILSEKPDAD